MELDNQLIAQNVKKLRQALNLSMLEFSQKLGYKGASSYFQIEKGKGGISIDFLNNVSRTFGVPITELLGLGSVGEVGRLQQLESKLNESSEQIRQRDHLVDFLRSLATLEQVVDFCAAYGEVAELRVAVGYEELKMAYASALSRSRTLLGVVRVGELERSQYQSQLQPLGKLSFPPLGPARYATLGEYLASRGLPAGLSDRHALRIALGQAAVAEYAKGG